MNKESLVKAETQRNTPSVRYEQASEECAPHPTPKQIAAEVAQWRAARAAELRQCLIPGMEPITKDACENMRRASAEQCGEELLHIRLDACSRCEHSSGVKLNRVPLTGRNHSTRVNPFKALHPDRVSLNECMKILKLSWNKVTRLIHKKELDAIRVEGINGMWWLVSKESMDHYNVKRYTQTSETIQRYRQKLVVTPPKDVSGHYSVEEVAVMLGMSRFRIGERCRKQTLAAVKVVANNRLKWMIPREEVQKIIDKKGAVHE